MVYESNDELEKIHRKKKKWYFFFYRKFLMERESLLDLRTLNSNTTCTLYNCKVVTILGREDRKRSRPLKEERVEVPSKEKCRVPELKGGGALFT